MIGKFDFFRRLFVIVLAILQPFIVYFYCGQLPSISQSWETNLQFLFILTNALVSYFFFEIDEWKIPSMFLLLLTSFSVPDHFWLHNIFAILFFVTCLIPLYLAKRFKYYLYIYLISILFNRSSILFKQLCLQKKLYNFAKVLHKYTQLYNTLQNSS
jgi:hypothetical protein